MRITFVALNYAPSVGGAQLHVQRIAEGLVARHGHEVTVLTTDSIRPPAGRNPGRVEVRAERIGGVDVRRFSTARRTQTAARLLQRVARHLRLENLDHMTSGLFVGPLSARLAWGVVRAARSSDVVVGVSAPFLTLTGSQWATRFGSAAHVALPLLHLSAGVPAPRLVRNLRRSDRCISNTPFERDWVVAHGLRDDRTQVIPPGCAPSDYPDITAHEARATCGLPSGLTIGYVGRLAVHKGIDTFLAALPALWRDHPDLNVLVAGSPTGWAELRPLLDVAAALGGHRFTLRESFTDAEKPLLMAALDVVAFPSREESFGMVTLDAWCARRPVVAADIDAVRSVIRPGRDGELVPVGDATALAGMLGQLVGDPARCQRLGEAGRRRVERDYSWTAVVDEWDTILHELQSSQSGASSQLRTGS